MEDLIELLKPIGRKVISAPDAYKGSIYKTHTSFACESLNDAKVNDSNRYEEVLRYPVEESSHEKETIDLPDLYGFSVQRAIHIMLP